jgi:type III secretory pathway component EscR
LYKIRVLTREVELLSKSIAKHRIKTILKRRDLINVWPVLTASFIENAFKLGYIYIKRVGALLESI